MAIPRGFAERQSAAYIESTVTANQPALAVVNPDGSNVGASVTVTADTEFPAAAAISDTFANPTTTSVMGMNMLWNGATWTRALSGAGAVANGVQRITLASDDPGVASLASIKTAVELIDNAISGAGFNITQIGGQAHTLGAGAVAAGTQRITLASDDPGVSSLASIKTAVELIDNAISGAGFNITQFGGAAVPIGAGAQSTALRVTESASAGAAQPSIDSYGSVAINLTTGADQVLVSSAASKQIWVYGYALSVGDAAGQTVSLQDEDNVALTGIMEFAQYGGVAISPSGNFAMPIFKCGTDKDLEIDITGGDVDGILYYAIVSV